MTNSPEFYNSRWERGNIPIKLRGLRLEDYEPLHRSGKIAKMEAIAFVDEFENHYVSAKRAAAGRIPSDRTNIGKGLMFYGSNGTRKTTLAAAILTEVQYRSAAYHVGYVRFSDWKGFLTTTFGKEETEASIRAKHMLKYFELCSLLVLDDIGKEYRTTTGFTESVLNEFLRIRYEAARPTIVTTNIEPEFMREVYGNDFESFRHDAFTTLQILGPDTRKLERN